METQEVELVPLGNGSWKNQETGELKFDSHEAEMQFNAWLLAEKDGFRQSPEQYWNRAMGEYVAREIGKIPSWPGTWSRHLGTVSQRS